MTRSLVIAGSSVPSSRDLMASAAVAPSRFNLVLQDRVIKCCATWGRPLAVPNDGNVRHIGTDISEPIMAGPFVTLLIASADNLYGRTTGVIARLRL
jgi:hypothetical protein